MEGPDLDTFLKQWRHIALNVVQWSSVILSFSHPGPSRLALLPAAPSNCKCNFKKTPIEVES